MNAPVPKLDPLVIPVEHIHDIIASATKLLADPRRDNVQWLNFLCAVDCVEGCDSLLLAIQEMESELGVGEAGEPECLACGGSGCACDARYEDGLTLVERISPTRIAL